jgi:hypothetical protein
MLQQIEHLVLGYPSFFGSPLWSVCWPRCWAKLCAKNLDLRWNTLLLFIMSFPLAFLLLSVCLVFQGAFIVSKPICQHSGYCKNSADCYPGNKCGNIHENLYYSQCIPDPNTYSTVPGCLTNFGRMCTATSQCCDPGSSCDLSDKYPQCKQPTAATGLKSTLKFYKKKCSQ